MIRVIPCTQTLIDRVHVKRSMYLNARQIALEVEPHGRRDRGGGDHPIL